MSGGAYPGLGRWTKDPKAKGEPEPPSLSYFFYGLPDAVLILQSAGTVVVEGVVTEDDESGSYLSGSAHNAAIVQNWAIRFGVPQKDIELHNFSVATGDDPQDVIRNFIKKPQSRNDGNGLKLIYYTGHGDKTGAWHFTLYGKGNRTVTVRPQDVRSWEKERKKNEYSGSVSVISQSCHSGNWFGGSGNGEFVGFGSALPNEESSSSSDGSEFTKWLFDGKAFPVDSTPCGNFGCV